jgi:hypothetical protein
MGLTTPPQINILLQNLQNLWWRSSPHRVIAPVKKNNNNYIHSAVILEKLTIT